MSNVVVWSENRLVQASLERFVTAAGFTVTPLEGAEVALWNLSMCTQPFPAPPPLPSLAIIHDSRRHAVEVLRLGYRGYFSAKDDPAHLRSALTAIARHELWAERRITAQAFETRLSPALTPREREVLLHVVAGRSNKEVAQKLELTENTVKSYVSKLFDKLGVKNRAGLILSQR